MVNYTANESECEGCAAARPIFGSFMSKDLVFAWKKLGFQTNLHTQCLEASTEPYNAEMSLEILINGY